MSAGAVLVAVDALYGSVVSTPERWNEAAFADWAASLASEAPDIDRASGRELRRAMRIAVKLQAFWSSPAAAQHAREADWQARVDLEPVHARARAEDLAGGREILQDETGLWRLEGESIYP